MKKTIAAAVLTLAVLGALTACGSDPAPAAPSVSPTPSTSKATKSARPIPKPSHSATHKAHPRVTKQTPTKAAVPAPKVTTSKPAPEPVYYANCAAVRAAGAAPIHVGDPGYSRSLDRDGDGIACE